jgi:hypothetical protein
MPGILKRCSSLMLRSHIRIYAILLFVIVTINCDKIKAETSIRSERAEQIGRLIWKGAFGSAIDSCQKLTSKEPSNPLGYF